MNNRPFDINEHLAAPEEGATRIKTKKGDIIILSAVLAGEKNTISVVQFPSGAFLVENTSDIGITIQVVFIGDEENAYIQISESGNSALALGDGMIIDVEPYKNIIIMVTTGPIFLAFDPKPMEISEIPSYSETQ